MKKIALIVASLIAVSVFADDALVLPAKVLRITTQMGFANADETYDADGEAQDSDNPIKLTVVGTAFEYGINDWITAAAQWAPGYIISSEVEDKDEMSLNDSYDIFAGAKFQLVGPKAPVVNEKFRAAIAAGVKIPVGGADFEKEAENFNAGDDYVAQNADNHILGIGFRGYADYVVNKMFFVNAYTAFYYYPGEINIEDAGLKEAIAMPQYNAAWDTYGAGSSLPGEPPSKVSYGYDLIFELEPTFQYPLDEGLRLSTSLPLTYTTKPGLTTDDSDWDKKLGYDSSYSFKIGPNVSVFFLKSFIPIEVKAQYITVLSGENTSKLNTVNLLAKFYLKF
jgi:hypothetical protein